MRPGQGTSLPGTEVILGWVEDGQSRLEERLAPLDDGAVAQPSRLPGWTRGHILTHLARNADALVNLLTWARTGTPTPMYPSAERRNADIEAGAGRPIEVQRDDLVAAARRLMETARGMGRHDWEAAVRSAQGRDIPAAEIPWMRAREVWIHLADLDVGAGFEVIPDEVAVALVHDVARWMDGRVERRVELVAPHVDAAFGGSPGQPAVRVHGSPQALAAWLVGRSRGETLEAEEAAAIPDLPPWL
ncbi:MAG TPA: maleylpyruvate isomerase family mycothiol-dependent enzyme [Candidatus Dormibacteraeota bacterium]|jgi:maleylpyruvate isomerase